MKRCRTCKYWAAFSDCPMVGDCLNVDASLAHLSELKHTSQNFGCVFHDEGECKEDLASRSEQLEHVRTFLLERFKICIDGCLPSG